MSQNIDRIREEFPEDKYIIIDGMSEIALLASNCIYPFAMHLNSNGFNSCIYKKEDIGFMQIHNEWVNTSKYDYIKLNNKSVGKVKKAFKTGCINDMKIYI